MAASRDIRRWLWLTGLSALVAMAVPPVSGASFEFVPGSVEVSTLDSADNPDTRAGAHPDRLLLEYDLAMSETTMRDLTIEFGPGLTGTPSAAPACSRAVFEDEFCPADTQVGVFTTRFGSGEPTQFPVYNIAPTVDQVANFGFAPLWQNDFGMVLRPTDYGLSMSAVNLLQLPNPTGKVELWGVPADHNGGSERAAILTTPTECGPLEVTLKARSWEPGAPWVTETAETEPFTECGDLPFEPDLSVQLDNPAADSPTGTRIDLQMTQHTGPDEVVSANLKEVEIDLPHGLTVSPGAAEGLDVCQDAQFGLGTEDAVTCPVRSRVGTVKFETPQLEEPLNGTIFLGNELPGERFRLFVYSTAPGVAFKAVGRLIADPQTGDLTAVLSDLPQFALSEISMKLDSVPLLVSPLGCGSASTQARFVPYGPQEPVVRSAVVEIGAGTGCPNPLPFSPGVVAGSTEVKAGSDTGFSFTLTRRDGEQLMKRFSATFPPGLNANLATIEPCAEAAAASGLCGPDSRVGSAVAEVGSGPSTGLVRGGVYVTERYRGAPFGLSIVFDATIGPFHLGSLDVRGALRLDPRTGQLRLETDPLPTIFAGLGLRFRTIGIDLDRPGFLLNPTSCEEKQIDSSITAVDGRVTSVVSPFYTGGCERLKFRPRVKLALKTRGKPRLSIAVRSHRGDANLRGFELKFPQLLAFHGRGVRAVCARGDALEGLCPASSQVGTGIVRTPLLDEPLRGSVYLVQPKGNGFPDFWSSLEGEGVEMQLTTESRRRGGDLVTELTGAPDVPLSTFTMNLNGGKDGLFSVKGNPCGRARSSTPVTLQAQNGARRKMRAQLDVSCAAGGH
jgi:hypothetical protein